MDYIRVYDPSFYKVVPKEPTAWRRVVQLIARKLPARVIASRIHQAEGLPLFVRYFVAEIPKWRVFGRLAGGTVYLHHYLQPDEIKGVHDHPWNYAIVLPLARGYIERRVESLNLNDQTKSGFLMNDPVFKKHTRKPLKPYTLTGEDFHTIESLLGPSSWSLFLHGPTAKKWGFLSDFDTFGWHYSTPDHLNAPNRHVWRYTAPPGSFYNA